MSWKDITGYSRDKERIPTTWSLDLGDLRLTVTCGHIYFKGTWIASCEPFFHQTVLGDGSKEWAQELALQKVGKKLIQASAALSALTSSER